MNTAASLDAPAPPPVRNGLAAGDRRPTLGPRFLGVGVASLAASFLGTAFSHGASLLLFFAGLFLVGFGWLMLVFLSGRAALMATVAAVVGCGGVVALAPEMGELSYRVLVWTHRGVMADAVRLMEPVAGTGPTWSAEPLCARLPGLPSADCVVLEASMREFGAFDAWKDGPATVFTTDSWIGKRRGILHCPREAADACAAPRGRHLTGEWYLWSIG
ncbi:hypothetical protein [Longimicrobium sp.]|uniref:hypothetical protein n=1 Tax=Longimicrobium sp. TaxID=2029185 RepID=UPI002E352E7F|nr:hypothetical protein [Longimicrobium sp.]HEX6037209.1 hypothetical protein [Longimicrobium sp.]